MGIYNKIKEHLPNQFSIYQLMELLEVGKSEIREVRNLLKQFYLKGYIKRISDNMYEKIK
ncbi:MAG: hypothetical protein ACOCT9_02400 [archaeon]